MPRGKRTLQRQLPLPSREKSKPVNTGDHACFPFATPPAPDKEKLAKQLALNEKRAAEKGL